MEEKTVLKRTYATAGARRLNTAAITAMESLENRLLFHHGFGFGGGGFGRGGFGGGGFGRGLNSIEFSQAPTAVQTGLETLATHDGLTPPTSTSTQTVLLGNRNGLETYSIDINGTGTTSVLTVDENGNPVTAPTNGTTTYGALPAAVTTEASAIATALNLTVPASTANVPVNTPAGGTSVYTIHFTSSTSSSSAAAFVRGRTISINANGYPVGNANLPFSVIPMAIQTALNGNLPAGATALATTSTQNVSIRTNDGTTTYSTRFTTSGTSTTVTVTIGGTLAKLPSHSTTTFSALSTTVQTAINTLAADNGVTATIAGTTRVQVYDEGNGTTIYSVNVSASKTGFSGASFTYNLTISVDQDGNPTTLPSGGGFGTFFGGFAGVSDFGWGFFGRRGR